MFSPPRPLWRGARLRLRVPGLLVRRRAHGRGSAPSRCRREARRRRGRRGGRGGGGRGRRGRRRRAAARSARLRRLLLLLRFRLSFLEGGEHATRSAGPGAVSELLLPGAAEGEEAESGRGAAAALFPRCPRREAAASLCSCSSLPPLLPAGSCPLLAAVELPPPGEGGCYGRGPRGPSGDVLRASSGFFFGPSSSAAAALSGDGGKRLLLFRDPASGLRRRASGALLLLLRRHRSG